MRFCTECGGALNLFETNDEELCRSCMQKREQTKHSTKSAPSPEDALHESELAEAMLYRDGNRLVLKARQGWVLWSGPDDQPCSLGSIIGQARRIQQIRMKRQRK